MRATSHHYGAAAPLALIRHDAKALAILAHGTHRGRRAHGRADEPGVARDEADHLRHRHEAIGISALVAVVRQPALPVGREQSQRVPALVPPGVGDFAALEHHVFNGVRRKEPAHRQPRVTGANDDDVSGAGAACSAGHFTSTHTFVGFVTMSNTAERRCDCATSALIASRVASASISKITLMPLKPLRTSLSMPRMPARSMPASSVAFTERSWILRFCATAAIPAVRQEARPTSTYSTGVAPLSSEAKIAGWSASYLNSVLCACSLPRPKKLETD